MFQKKVLITMASVALLAGLTGCKVKTNGTAAQDSAPAAQTQAQAPVAVQPLDMNKSTVLQINALPTKGNPNAKVTIVEFSDYQCPFCSRAEPTINQLLKDYPNDIRVAFVHFPLSFHQNAKPAAKAAYAAFKQGKHWEMHDALFANQKGLTEDFFHTQAQKLGLDMAKFDADMNSPEADKIIDKGMKDANPYGVSGTPSFVINGVVLVGAQPVDAFKKVIDEQIKRADEVAKAKNLSGEALYEELVKTAPKPAPEEPEEDDTPAGRVMVDISNAPSLGDENAPVTLVEFTDFECPFCSRGNSTIHDLMNNNPGKVRIVFHHYPLPFHKNAKLAHQAVEAAKAQGKFWEYYDLLFQNQKALDRESLLKYAEQVGLDKAKFEADMDNEATAKIVEDDIKLGSAAGVRGTPHFLLNGTALSGAQPLPAFQAALDKELEAAKPYIEKGMTGAAIYEQIVKDNPVAKPAPKPEPKPIVINVEGAPFKGAADAPVTIVQFSEFQCPFCSRVEPTIAELMNDPAYAGKIKVVFKQFPLGFHKNAQKAAEAALFAHANGKFWELHEKMFANQQALEVENLLGYAKEVGLDADALKAALDADTYKAAVEADSKAGAEAGISGTPSFVINGKLLVGAQPIDAFKSAIDAALAAK